MNFQNIPRSDKTIKELFKPKLDYLCFWDYQAIEMRFLAYYLATLPKPVTDTSLVEVFNRGEDPHRDTAKRLFNTENPTDEERQTGKTLNFSLLYGGGTPTIQRQLGISRIDAAKLLHKFHTEYPSLMSLRVMVNSRLRERGFIKTPWGRLLSPDSEHKALNALIQGAAADLMKASMARMFKYRQESRIKSHYVLMIHDEVIWDVAADELEQLRRDIPLLMTDAAISKIIPIEVSFEISSTTWAGKHPPDQEEIPIVPEPAREVDSDFDFLDSLLS